MKVLCCGDRNWDQWAPIWTCLRALKPLGYTQLVHGNARGADRMSGFVGQKIGYEVFPVAAEWEKHGRAAGPIRNRKMLTDHPDIELVVAFHADLANSKGTKDMVEIAEARGIRVERITG